MKELLEKYEIESVEEFNPEYVFYDMNLSNGYKQVCRRKAKENLLNNYSKEELIKVKNYDEIGIIEAVADNDFYIEDNLIKRYE